MGDSRRIEPGYGGILTMREPCKGSYTCKFHNAIWEMLICLICRVFRGVGSVDGKVLRCDVYAQLRMMSLLMESNRNAPRPLELACHHVSALDNSPPAGTEQTLYPFSFIVLPPQSSSTFVLALRFCHFATAHSQHLLYPLASNYQLAS